MVPYLHRVRENEGHSEETCIIPLKPATLAASGLGPELCASKGARSGPKTNESGLGFATMGSGVRPSPAPPNLRMVSPTLHCRGRSATGPSEPASVAAFQISRA